MFACRIDDLLLCRVCCLNVVATRNDSKFKNVTGKRETEESESLVCFCCDNVTIAMHGNWQSMTYQMMKYHKQFLKVSFSKPAGNYLIFVFELLCKEYWMGLILTQRKLQILSWHVTTGYWYFSTDWSNTRRPRWKTNSTGWESSGFSVEASKM